MRKRLTIQPFSGTAPLKKTNPPPPPQLAMLFEGTKQGLFPIRNKITSEICAPAYRSFRLMGIVTPR